MNRSAWLLQDVVPNSRILEIGPSHHPLAPKSAGWRTHVVDHATQAELRAKYAQGDLDLAAIEPVDTVWHGGPLHEAVGGERAGAFDVILASHVVEHLPDLLGFLISAEHLLAPAGRLVLAVPDRRYCFDFFKPLTTTGDLLEAHAAGRTRHALHTVWNQHAYSVTLAGRVAWGFEPPAELAFADSFAAAAATEAGFRDDPAAAYADCHAWHFTPARFHLVLLELGQLGRTDWRVADMETPGGAEFLVRLVRGAERFEREAELQAKRLALLREGLEELRAQIDGVLGATDVPPPRPVPVSEPDPEPEPEPQAEPKPDLVDWGVLPLLRVPAQ